MDFGWFYFLAIMNNAAVNIQVFVWTYVFISFEYTLQNEISKSECNCILPFEELPDCFAKWL